MWFFALVFGVLTGSFVWHLQRQEFYRRLEEILLEFAPETSEISYFSAVSLVRRALRLAQEREQRHQREIAFWRECSNQSPTGFLVVDEENQLLWCNAQARSLLGIDRWQPDQVRLLLEVVRSYELDQLIEQTRHQGQSQALEWVRYSPQPQGEVHSQSGLQSLGLRGTSACLPEGRIGIFLENRQPHREFNQEQERAISDLAHELRTPLTAIRLVGEALQDRLHGGEKRWVDQMLTEVNRLFNLVQDWLHLSALQSGPVFSFEPIFLADLVEDAWGTVAPLAQEKDVSLRVCDLDYGLEGDRHRLIQVLVNLLDNAIKYSPNHGAIIVKAQGLPSEEQPEQIRLEVMDEGPGFHPPDLPRVFDRLYRGDISRTRTNLVSQPGQGSGLGLAICREIITGHRGQIIAQNSPENGGGWLVMTLPCRASKTNINPEITLS